MNDYERVIDLHAKYRRGAVALTSVEVFFVNELLADAMRASAPENFSIGASRMETVQDIERRIA